ncbi:MAG: DMT family transporter [Albidovulum sp.]|nr:DMT family transporter [Albidovulum sp.]MDE0306358.1 DMT family transporter [Albidovulum sp.]MDE0532168.1 DMT family transporter [Albidovulum sp.]
MSPQIHISKNFTGILCAFAASLGFSITDMSIKFLSGDYPLHQIIFIRSLVALGLTLAIIIPLEGGFANLKTRRPLAHLIRGLCLVLANLMFFASLAILPLGDAVAIFFVAPLMTTALSVVILRERVGLKRWSAVALGLIGVIFLVKPGQLGFQPATLLPVGAACFYAVLQIVTRKIGLTERASTMAFYIQLIFAVASVVFGICFYEYESGFEHPSVEFITRPWVWPEQADLAIMVGVGVASAASGYFISQAYRIAQVSSIAPIEYTALVMAVFWGVVVWTEWPPLSSWIGILLILASGITVALREKRTGTALASKRIYSRR